ncbi:MAG: DUF4159 domain-containing protein [Pseudomonadota bacterium]
MASLSALSFSTPLILGALLTLPILWVLLRATPPSPSRVSFPAFVILRQLTDAEETPDITPWWLLLLRLLIAALVIIGLAGPVLNAPKPAPGAGPMVLVADDTWAAAPAWRARTDAMELAIAEAEAADRPIFLMTTAPSSEPAPLAPLTADEARDLLTALVPKPFRADLRAAHARLPNLEKAPSAQGGDADVRWFTDGLQDNGAGQFADALADFGALTIYADDGIQTITVRSDETASVNNRYRVDRDRAGSEWRGDLVAIARDGRELARAPIIMTASERTVEATLDLPLALRNNVSYVRLENTASAAAVYLMDARNRRALIGLIEDGDGQTDRLLTGAYYVQKALQGRSAFLNDTLENLLASDVSVIVLDDVGRLRTGDTQALEAWMENGGVVIRFAGPNLADAAQDETPALLPVALRGGGRAFGGALSWETPQGLGAFNPDGPFATLTPPGDVKVRRQVLARPGGDTSLATWAELEDGTPLVTGVRKGDGALVLFHVTATPAWSDLPISATFIDMLRKLILLSVFSPQNAETEATARFAPHRVLDGFGRFEKPNPAQVGVTALEAAAGPAPARPPGFYGAADAPLAINTLGADEKIAPLSLRGYSTQSYAAEPPANLAPPLFAAALFLFLIDGIAALLIAGRLRLATAATVMLVAVTPLEQPVAQPLDMPIDEKAETAALATRLAYVETGDPELDRLSELGLKALSRVLRQRTAIEPADPIAIDLETDDLSVFPFLYWPMTAGAVAPSEAALANIENFMRFGGLVVFDTRDDERAIAGLETPERAALRAILSQLDVPPLTPLPEEHVLKRSYYLLTDLVGRMWNNPVWVQASGGANDAVTPLIISGRDWAGAWASDDLGRPVLPISGAGARRLRCAPQTNVPVRECAMRAGVNMVMVAFTGNYKSDQVHTPILLRRLGRRDP